LTEEAEQHIAKAIQRFTAHATHFSDAIDVVVHFRLADVFPDGEHDDVRGVRDLVLVPGSGNKFLLRGLIGDDDESPWLQTKRRRREHERLFERAPVRSGNPLRWVELLGGIAPAQLRQERVIGNRFGIHMS
jgi:hypothetical protein